MNETQVCDLGACNKRSAIRDISLYSDPGVFESLDYEKILLEIKNQIQQFLPVEIQVNQLYEGDPIVKIAETIAYREMYMRQRIIDALKDSYLKTAKGSALSQLLYLFGLSRANPQDQNASEYTDGEMVNRLIELYEGTHTGGASQGYRDICLSVENIKNAFIEIDSCIPAKVNVYVWVDAINGSANYFQAMSSVREKVNSLRPVTDWVDVKPIEFREYELQATLTIPASIALQDIKKRARNNLRQYLNESHKIGYHVKRSEIIAKLNQDGVIRVDLHSPADIMVDGGELAVMIPKVHNLSSSESYLLDGTLEYSDEELDSLITFKTDTRDTGNSRLKPREITFQGEGGEGKIHRCVIGLGINRTLRGTLTLIGAEDEKNIRGYNLYFGISKTAKHNVNPFWRFNRDCNLNEESNSQVDHFGNCIRKVTDPDKLPVKPEVEPYTMSFNPNLYIPEGATHIIAFSVDNFGEMESGISIPIKQEYVPTVMASSLLFDNRYNTECHNNLLTGMLTFDAAEEGNITHYNLYWADESGLYLTDGVAGNSSQSGIGRVVPIQTFQKNSIYEKHFYKHPVPKEATQLILVSANEYGEMDFGLCIHIPEDSSLDDAIPSDARPK